MTDETPARRPRRRAASRVDDMPDTPDAIEIAMKAIATGADQHASARTVLEKHAVLLDVQSRREQEEWALLRLQRLTRWLFIGTAVALLLGVAATLWAASLSRSLIVEPFSVPPALAERGVTGEVVAARVLDRLADMQRQTTSVRAESSYSNNWQDNVEVNVLDAGFSIGEVWRALRQWLGKETRISGEIVAGPDGTLSMTTRAGVLSSAPVSSDTGDIDQLVRMGAEEVYSVTQPYRYAIFLQGNGRVPESEAVLLALTRAADPLERRWGYNGLSVLHRSRGEIDAALFNARQALEIDPRMVPALSNVGSAYLRLGREERGLEYYQASAASWRSDDSGYNPIEGAANHASRKLFIASRLGDTDGLAEAFRELGVLSPDRAASAAGVTGYESVIAQLAHDWSRARRTISTLTVGEQDQANYERVLAEFAVAAALDLDDAAAAGASAQALKEGFDALIASTRETTPEQVVSLELTARTDVYPGVALGFALGGRSGEAIALIEQTPLDCYDCVLARGHVAALAGNRRAAEHWWREAMRIGPSIPMGYEALGRSRLEAGDAAGALTLFRTAQEKGPRWADPVKGEADALVRLGRTREALRRYAAAAERAPRWGALHLAWARALEAEGRSAEARETYAAAAGMDLSAADRAEVTRRVATAGLRS
jgi:tetratricopeptide (TPR) repeat protein